VFPIIDVPSWRVFALKIITVILVANIIGIGMYTAGGTNKTKTSSAAR
jgi:hypothetical protein